MGAHRRTNPERLPRGGGAELKWKQRAGAVWEATETKAAAEGTPPPPVSHPRRGNHTSTLYCSLRMERQDPARGGGTWHPLWASLARGSGGSGVPQPGPPPACHCFKPCHVAGQAGITPNPQETDRAQRLALVRPAVGAAPDTLRENTHACCLLQGSQLRTALRCTRARGLQRLEREAHEGDGHSDWGVGACPGGPQAWGNPPHSQAHPHPFPALTLEVQNQAGGAEQEPLNAPLTPPA